MVYRRCARNFRVLDLTASRRHIIIVNMNSFPLICALHYNISQDQELFKQAISELAQSDILPVASRIDWEANASSELLQKLAGAGLFGITVPQEYGGVGTDFLSLVLSVEELSKFSGSLGAQVSFHNGVVCEALVASANKELKARLLPKLASGTLGAFSLDPNSTVSYAVQGDSVVINGASEYVMSATLAGVFLVLARSKQGNIVICFDISDVNKPEFSIGETIKLLGMRASGTASMSFRGLRLSKESIAFSSTESNAAITNMLKKSRLAVAAQALGLGQASLDASVKYSSERSQFNTKIGKFYAVRDFVAQDQIAIEGSRSLTYSVASDLSRPSADKDSAIAKVSASNAAVQAARHSIRVHGGYGFTRDYPVERYLRDARATQLYIESNEALKDLIAASIIC